MTTFDGGWERYVGQVIPIEYEVERVGKFTNYKITSDPPKVKLTAEEFFAGASGSDDDTAVLLEILATVKRIEQALADQRVPF